MTKKELVLVASRVVALYFIFWAFDNLSYLPVDAFSLSHYRPLAGLKGEDYLFKYHLLLVLHRLVVSAFFFIGATWVYKCGPAFQHFLSPSED